MDKVKTVGFINEQREKFVSRIPITDNTLSEISMDTITDMVRTQLLNDLISKFMTTIDPNKRVILKLTDIKETVDTGKRIRVYSQQISVEKLGTCETCHYFKDFKDVWRSSLMGDDRKHCTMYDAIMSKNDYCSNHVPKKERKEMKEVAEWTEK